jgi:hypothetical protein
MATLQNLCIKYLSSLLSSCDLDELIRINASKIDISKLLNQKFRSSGDSLAFISISKSFPLFITGNTSDNIFHKFIQDNPLVSKFLERWLGENGCDFTRVVRYDQDWGQKCQLKDYEYHYDIGWDSYKCVCETGIHVVHNDINFEKFLKYRTQIKELSDEIDDFDENWEEEFVRNAKSVIEEYNNYEKYIPYDERPSTMYHRLKLLFFNDDRIKSLVIQD